ncbi:MULTISPECIES: hypothetical protein [Agrobacterium tumefaciens complex]|uniref:hypothetical protein n=1 Tax=Agrobacterium tumefaciens complex TaxID=1183400 RepID=UPI000B177E12|nr:MULTISPECIES: hypothetical protein [Agrobacterium tumefaciens complex]NSL21133.1 hypothetical protein [Agrobacterium tumefaciens]NTC57456.1 hypothetical protein [Agrobacterium tumefaciens]NTC59540.1 hypothetical protein [Agrobacterium tumefaciens]NTC66626.1 hypothetical protein [Agrobacterium tumefaciens]NTC69973.1 hypothetical protein [Agrobacterium tumefaciens]
MLAKMAETNNNGLMQSYLQQQHKLRGIISQFKSKEFVEQRRFSPSLRFRQALNELYISSKIKLTHSQYAGFIAWANEMLASQLSELDRIPIRYDNLSGVIPKEAVDLSTELRWITARLHGEKEKISRFLFLKEAVEGAAIGGDYTTALNLLEIIFDTYGATMWSVQLRIALEQVVGGLEQQKKYAAQVRSIYKQGLLAYVTYHTSVRNEERTTISKYFDEIERRISNHAYYDDATQTYMRYRLKNELPATDAGIADVLRTEQSHGIIDIYETFIAVLQELVKWEGRDELHQILIECVSNLGVSDYRLQKIQSIFVPQDINTLLPRSQKISDFLFSGSGVQAFRAARKSLPSDPWQVIYAGFAHASSQRPPRSSLNPKTLHRWLAAALAASEQSNDYAAQAAKLCINFRGLSFMVGVGEYLAQLRRDKPDSAWKHWVIGLNSPTHGIEDLLNPKITGLAAFPETPTKKFWSICLTGQSAIELDSPSLVLGRSLYQLAHANPESACEILAGVEDPPLAIRALCQLARLHALHAFGFRHKKIELIASESVKNLSCFNLFPVAESLRDCAWEDFKSVESPLAAPIALHLLWSRTEESQTASQLRFATGLALRKLGVNRPSALLDRADLLDDRELVYFLKHVCVPEILDVTRLFSSSKEVLEERRNIFLALSDLRPESADDYTAEAMLISHNLMVDEGRWIVDRTRIHVEDEAFVRWASRELQEDYERYRDLEPVSVDAPQTFDDVLRELDGAALSRHSFSPDNEADAVLMSVIRRAGDEFLTNATFGLDFYLAKNVRHHSFIGLIRGPLEVSGLITTRETETSEYHPNRYWLESFKTLETADRTRMELAFRNFSAHFDDILLDAKDRFFHVRTAEYPSGMLAIPYSDALYSVVRVWLTLDLDITTFFRFLITVFWISLEQSLQAVRQLISVVLKGALVAEFDKLRSSVKEIAEFDPGFLEFDAEAGKRSAEVQGKLDEASQWFVHTGALASQHLFTLEQILEVGLEATLTTQRGYSPRINKSTTGSLSLDAANLVFVHDVLFVGLGNTKKHSGLPSPKIDIAAKWSDEAHTLSIEIISDCKASVRPEKAKRAAEVRQMVSGGTYSRQTRKDDGSGFAKLAAIVTQSDRGRIEFGFGNDGRFRLEVTYAVVLQTKDSANG